MDTKKNITEILNRLDNTELELLHSDIEYAKTFLKEEGFDIEQELSFSVKHIAKIQFMTKAIKNKTKDQELLEITYNKLKKAIQENAQKATDTLITLLQSKRPAMQYRKLDKWTDDEIREVLADVDLIELIEELEKED